MRRPQRGASSDASYCEAPGWRRSSRKGRTGVTGSWPRSPLGPPGYRGGIRVPDLCAEERGLPDGRNVREHQLVAVPCRRSDSARAAKERSQQDGIDFEAYEQFQPAKDNADWFPLWTGNKDLDGSEYRVFGQDGTGGYAAFWMIRPGKEVLEQPIVFFGSEGEVGVVARDFTDYVWLLAGGVGPMEAVEGRTSGRQATPHLAAFAERHAPRQRKSVDEVIARAKAEFPKFEASIRALCK